jgi:type I restriction enzyme S subunit
VENDSCLDIINMKPNWQTKKLEDCLDKIVYTNKIQRKDFLEAGAFPIISQEAEFINGYWNSKKDLFHIKKPVVIFGDHTQVLKYVDFDFVLGADGVKILCPKDFLNPRFFYYFLQSGDLKNLGYARHYRLLKEVEVYYPESLPSQHRLVKILDEVFEKTAQAKERAEKNLQNAKDLFVSYLEGVFANPEKGWQEKRLGEICEIVNGGTPDTKVLDYWDGDNLWITPKDMGKLEDIYVSDTIRKISNSGLENSSAKLLPANSVILSSRAPIGYLAVNQKEMATNQGCKGLIPCNKLEAVFLYYFLKSAVKLLNSLGSGTTFKELSSTKLAEVVMSLPSFKVQKSLVVRLDALSAETRKLETIYQQKLADLEELKKSVLKKAFNGEL